MKSALIIEDSSDVNSLWRKVARRCFYWRVHCATTLSVAEKFIDHYDYGVIISDIHMPKGNAPDLLVKKKERVKDSKIIIISAASDETMKAAETALIEEGLNLIQCLKKPIQNIRALKALLS